MRGLSILLLVALAGCGGSKSSEQQAENVALDPAVLQPKPTASSLAGVDFTKAVRAFGTEPYWALDITPEAIRFEDFGVKDGEPVDWAPHAPSVTGRVATIETAAATGEAVTITLTGESCLEVGEEASALPLKAEIKIGARTLTGCAGQKLAGAAGAEADNAASAAADNAGI